MEFREARLENGLEIVAERHPEAYTAALAFFVRAGARDEADATAGVSHFLEHMAFKGSHRRSAADVNRELDEMGASSNAQTSEERTVYYAAVLPEFQDRMTDLLADLLRPALRTADFEMEKKVILEEIRMYDDQPPFGAHERLMASHFGPHPLGRSVLGTEATVGALTPEQMRAYFESRYAPGNIVLAAAGRIDFEALVAAARRCCGGWAPRPAPRETPPAPPRSGFELLHRETASQQYTLQLVNGPAAADPQRYAARTLATILGDDTGSRFFWELIDTGAAEHASLGCLEYQGAGVQMTYLCCEPEETAANLDAIRHIVREAEREGVTQAELEQAKSKLCAHVVLQSERPINRLFALGTAWLQRREYRTVREAVQAYQQVTRDDVAAVLARFPLSESTTVTAGPLAELAWP